MTQSMISQDDLGTCEYTVYRHEVQYSCDYEILCTKALVRVITLFILIRTSVI